MLIISGGSRFNEKKNDTCGIKIMQNLPRIWVSPLLD